MKSQRARILIAATVCIMLGTVALYMLAASSLNRHAPASDADRFIRRGTSTVAQTDAPCRWYRVVHVFDGDTVLISGNGTTTRVRLLGIDTPEVQGPYTRAECYGNEASALARKLLAGRQVCPVYDPSQDRFDRYGRLLAYLFLPDGTNVNELLIRYGAAREYTFAGRAYRYRDAFVRAEAQARAERRGLWGACPENE